MKAGSGSFRTIRSFASFEATASGKMSAALPGITTCAVKVLDAAVEKAYKGKRKIVWFDVHAGDVARAMYNPGSAMNRSRR